MTEMVTIGRAEYERLLAAEEELQDIVAFDRARSDLAMRADEAVSAGFARRLIAGENPLRVYRELRGLTQVRLGEVSAVNRVQIADIEAGRKSGSVETVRKLSVALGITIDDLV